MQLDKSKILLFGGLVLLVVVLMNGGLHLHGFGIHHGGSWTRWVLFGLLFWFLFSRGGCCGGCGYSDDSGEEEAEESSDDE